MKTIRTKQNVLLNAQEVKSGIAVIKMERFIFDNGKIIAFLGYYEQVPTGAILPGEPIYKYNELPISGSIATRNNVKKLTFKDDVLNAIFAQVGIDIISGEGFTESFYNFLTQATIRKVVADKNFDLNNTMTLDDWEVIPDNETVQLI